MDAERERVAIPRDFIEQRIELAGAPAHDVQDRSEHLLPQIARALEHDNGRRDVGPSLRQLLEGVPTEAQAALPLLVGNPAVELVKATPPTRGSATSAAPTLPSPGNRCSALAGIPA